MQMHQGTNQHLASGDWLELAKHFEKHGEQAVDENFQPIEFSSTEEHAKYLEEHFTQSAQANSAAMKKLMEKE